MDLARIGLAPLQCECSVVPLDYRPIIWKWYYLFRTANYWVRKKQPGKTLCVSTKSSSLHCVKHIRGKALSHGNLLCPRERYYTKF